MKLKNFFKKESVQNTTSKQVLSKDQLEKVIGGAEGDIITPVDPIDPGAEARVGKAKYKNITL